jgi:anaerobic ribonucleoside-triphosphate reductase activating protein
MTASEILRVHHIEPASLVNGPGRRFVVWVQGCTLGCPGCFNPATFPKDGGIEIQIDLLADQILSQRDILDGVTISGGEPLQQIQALSGLLVTIKKYSQLSVLVFSGFTWAEIQRIPHARAFLAAVDVLLAGRYQADKRIARGLLGSSNKTAYFLSSRYSMRDLEQIPEAEVLIGRDGSIISTGIDPLSR